MEARELYLLLYFLLIHSFGPFFFSLSPCVMVVAQYSKILTYPAQVQLIKGKTRLNLLLSWKIRFFDII